jgi:hypothetical protein
MSYLKPNTAGVYDIPSANIDTLYIKGKKFQQYIDELVIEDQLEQSEITEIKLLLEYLDTTGLNSAWTVTNSNVNETLRSAITALQTKLANIDTTALTETSVLNNDNRNSVLKTRLDTAATDITALTTRVTTAEGDIDNLETRMTTAEGDIDDLETRETAAEADIAAIEDKTDYIVITNGDPTNAATTHGIFIGNKLSVPPDATKAAKKVATFSVGRIGQGFAVEYDPSITTPSATGDGNRVVMNNTLGGHAIIQANHTRIQGGTEINIGEVGLGVAGYETINVGGSMSTINIGSVDDPVFGTTPGDPATGKSTTIKIGKIATLKNTWTYLQGNIFLANARFDDLPKTDKFTWTQIAAFLPTSGLPLWVVSFALTSSIPNFEYSDTFVLKDGGTAQNKTGEATTSNNLKTSGLVIFNRDLNIAQLTPIEGTFLARGTISKSTLDGSIRNSVFLDGGGNNVIALKHHNIAASDITEWATTEANSKVNVVEIGGNSGILIHQGASNAGTDLKLINTKGGNIVLKCGATSGLLADAKDSFTVLHDANQPGAAIGRLSTQAFDTDETNRTNNPIARLEVECVPNRNGIRLFGYDPAQPLTMLPQETTINNQSVSTQSLVFNANYTGNTDARLYKNADNKLMWNGAEVGAGGVSSGGITYMINVPTNITNPNPTPTETIMTAAYSGNAQRTITQAVTANTAYYIAKYTTEVFDEASNPVLTGLQQLNQYLVWSSNTHTGQIYGRLWFQATAVASATLYQRTYASPVTTTATQLINGTPILTPKGLYNIKFQRVVFPNINVVVTSGPVVLRYRVEGYDFLNEWTTIATMAGAGQSVSSTTNNVTVSLDEAIELNQTSAVGAKTALRLVLFIASGAGTISQTSAGGEDLGAYSLIGVGAGTPAIFRTLLHDGTNAKVITPHTTTPTLIEYDLPIDAPYNVSAFPSPTLSTDLYFVQPTGGGNNSITLYFNDGSLSHYHSTITPPQVTPTLAQVLNSGATASQAINMNTNKISGITTLEGAANGNWNVKEITAGTGIGVSDTTGTYTIENTGVLSVAAASGSPGISVSTTSGAVTLQNTGILSITAGTGISVSTTDGVAVITNTAGGATQVGVAQSIRDEHQSLYEVGALPRKPDYWATNWSVASNSVGRHLDLYVSVDGKLIVSAIFATGIKRNTNYGIGDFNISVTIIDAPRITTLCGTSSGSKLFAFGFYISQTQVQSLAFFSSTDEGLTWTRITSSTFTGLTQSERVRCSGDGTYLLASDSTLIAGARFLFSTDGGATWTRRTLNAALASGYTTGVAMSRSGAVQFIIYVNNAGTDSKIFRSLDYGVTFTEVFGHISGARWTRIETDATGRYVWATRYDTINNLTPPAWYSDNYGSAWYEATGWSSLEDVWVSATGQYVVGVSVPNPSASNHSFLVYSSNYGRNLTYQSLGPNTYRTINGSADGSVLVLGSSNETEGNPSYTGDGLIRIARQGLQNIQDLSIVGGTISKASGVYTLTNDIVLWASGSLITSTDTAFPMFDWSSTAGNIDLNLFNIRYEIECNWNYNASGTPYAYIHIAPNNVSAIDFATDPNTSFTAVAGVTNWTRVLSGPTYEYSGAEFNYSYRDRFFCGYSNPLGPNSFDYRIRTILNGELMLQARPTAQSGISDTSQNERNIFNRFTCNNYTTQFVNGNWFIYSVGTMFDPNNSTERIDGTAIFSAGIYWSGFLASGINRIGLRLTEGFNTNTTRPRGAHYTYRIFRVRK